MINLNGFFVNICGSITVILGIALLIRWIARRGRAGATPKEEGGGPLPAAPQPTVQVRPTVGATAGSSEPTVIAPQPSAHKTQALSILGTLANPPITEPLDATADVDLTLCMNMVLDAGGTPHDTALTFLIERIQRDGPIDALGEAQRLTGMVIALQSSKVMLSQTHLIALKHLEDGIRSPKVSQQIDGDTDEEFEEHNSEERATIEGAFDCVALVTGTLDERLFHRLIRCLSDCERAIGNEITAKALLVQEFIKGATEGRGMVVNGRHFQITSRMSPGLEGSYRTGVAVRLERPDLVDEALRTVCKTCKEAHRSYVDRAF